MAKRKRSARGGRGRRPAAIPRAVLSQRRAQAWRAKEKTRTILGSARDAFDRNPTPAAQRAVDRASQAVDTARNAWRAARDAVKARGKNRARLARRAASLSGTAKRQAKSAAGTVANVARSTFQIAREVEGLKHFTRITWTLHNPGAGWRVALTRMAERAQAEEPKCNRWQAAADMLFLLPHEPLRPHWTDDKGGSVEDRGDAQHTRSPDAVRRRFGTGLYETAMRAAEEITRWADDALGGRLGEHYRVIGFPLFIEIVAFVPTSRGERL